MDVNKFRKTHLPAKQRSYRSFASTVMGYLVATATALSTIDFGTFDWKKEWLHVVCVILIAIGGHMTSISAFKQKEG